MAKKVALLLAEGFEEVEAVTPIDFLRRVGVEVIVTGIGGDEITGAHNIQIKTDRTIENLTEDLDGLILPGGMPGALNIASSKKAIALIKRMNTEGKLVAAICASPAVILEKAGVLNGKEATCYPSFRKDLKSCKPSNDRVVHDGNIVTSQGPGTAAEFSIKLAEILVNKQAADSLFSSTIQ